MSYEKALEELMKKDPRIVILTAENRAAIRKLSAREKRRFFDFGIMEQTMIAASAGLALKGLIPVVHALAPFLTMRAFEFIRTDVGYPGFPVKLIGYGPGFLSEANGPTHQALEDIALMRMIPGMQIFCPADEEDMILHLPQALASPAPCYIRFNPLPPIFRHDSGLEYGDPEIIFSGSDVTFFTYGTLFNESFDAVLKLRKDGRSIGLVHLPTLKPLNKARICEIISETDYIVTVEDHFLCGGLYAVIAQIMTENCLQKKTFPFALKEKWFVPARLPDILKMEGFSGVQLAETLSHLLDS